VTACEHCGNPDKSKWTSQCSYKGSYPSRRAFVLSTFDAPCAMDAYDERQDELERSRRRWPFWLAIVLMVAILALVAFCGPASAYSCDLVRQYRDEIAAMDSKTKRTWIKRLKISKSQVRKAARCLRG
jgi:hypothetical protein